jgi:hypothetical protein
MINSLDTAYNAASKDIKEHQQELKAYYASLFNGKDPSSSRRDFWDDFFLYHPQKSCFMTLLHSKKSSDFCKMKDVWRNFLYRSLDAIRDQNEVRQSNALEVYIYVYPYFIRLLRFSFKDSIKKPCVNQRSSSFS